MYKRSIKLQYCLFGVLLTCIACSNDSTQSFGINTSVTPANSGEIIQTPLGNIQNEGTNVSFEAVPEVGFEFSRWSGSIDFTSNPVSISISEDVFLTAIFENVLSPQEIFEQQSLTEPEGITRTDFSARITSLDENDWRIGPLFVGSVNVFNPPFPNPIGNQNVRFELDVLSSGTVEGLTVVANDEAGFKRTIFTFPSSPLPAGIVSVQFPSRLLDSTGIFTNAKGIHRIWCYDRLNRLITYGDILVQD